MDNLSDCFRFTNENSAFIYNTINHCYSNSGLCIHLRRKRSRRSYWFVLDTRQRRKVEIFKKENKYYGKLILSGKSADDKDEHNPDPKLRDRPLNGKVFLTNFEYFEKESKWINGRVYGADNGKSYRAFMKLKNGNLLLRGYLGISLIGRTETFERIK
jgi:uncharacterized protein (DUF2147 family)